MSGGKAIVEVMVAEGVESVFCVPGESYLGVLDALYDTNVRVISARHEGGASFMAEGYAKMSGKVGVCMATRGVGSANLSIGIHTAYQDSTPMVVLIGQVERPFKSREAFQEVDLAGYYSHIAKWAVEIDDANRIPEIMHRAFAVAQSGRPGPVVVGLPHDMLEDVVDIQVRKPYSISVPGVDAALVKQSLELLASAERPVLIAGGGVTLSGSTSELVQFAEKFNIPVVTAFRRFDAFPNQHPNYIGWLGFGPCKATLDAIKEADVILALGTRFSQVSTQDYELLREDTKLIHVDISSNEIGKVYAPEVAIVSDAKAFLVEALKHEGAVVPESRVERIAKARDHYETFATARPYYNEEYTDMEGVIHDLIPRVPENTVITSDAGNFFGWVCRFYPFKKEKSYIGPTSGAMGYGLPGAIGAKIASPDSTVIAFAGDGGFMMTMQELETAARYNVPVITIVVNNNMYGTIRAHQEKHFPGRVVATELSNPDYAALARLFGCHGETVKSNAEFVPALQRAIDSGKPALIEVQTDPNILSVSQVVR
ncbi:thiamine pyrophosphate-dependent enzyme [Ammoniphilus sp. CFH 90114]|uniref:thiamine pyrophosphate-dependent enzyme n=1 Tax=Ammoniphilus sp. CFH 90114 TaxID=2493665 RepID=UPI00100F0910|nr:thiamine pyrophosphate-dependent enzyme [Ammoniphilus sp. CFH 90114]RXT05379.1 acetolactate synthase [Ammoniphilus sp. CFH 90114]